MRASKNTIPITKALKVARLSSFVIFPELQNTKSICSIETARKPIRERAFYKGLRLMDFSDSRLKIKKTSKETEYFFQKYHFRFIFLEKS